MKMVKQIVMMAFASLLAQCVWAALPTPVAHWTNLSEGATGDTAGKFTVKAGTGCTFSNGQAVLAKNSSTATTGLLVEWENGQVPAGSLTVVVKYSGYNSSGLGFNSLLATKWGNTYEEVAYANGGGNNVGLSANVTTSEGGTQNLANPAVAIPAAGYMVVTMSTDGNYGTSVSFRGAANASFSQATYQSGHRYDSQAFKGIKIGGTQAPIGKYHRPAMTIEEVTLYTTKLTADDFNAELPRTASFTVANETDWSTKTLPTTVDTAYARANTSFANNADYKQTLASGEATVVNVTDVSNNAYIYGLHAFEGQNGIGAITRDIYLMVSGGAPAVISGGEDASWNSSTKTIPTGNVLVNITGDTTVDYVYGAGLGGGTGNGLAKIIGNVGIVVDGNAQVKGSLIAGWQSRHNTIPEVTGNTSILIKNVQTHYQDATLSTDNQRCEQGWIAAGGIHKTNGGRSKVGGNASVTVQLGDDATGTFNKHIVAGGIGIGGGDGQNVTGDGTVTITAPNAVVFAKNVVGGGHSTGNNARIGGNTSVTLNGGTYTGTIYAGGDHSAATVGGTATLTITKGDFSKATLNGGTATGAKALSVANAVIDPSKISGFGTVEIKAGTTFALPAGTASGASYALGTLTADESVLGEQLVAVGARQRKMTIAVSGSNLTFTDVASDTSVSITAETIAELGLAEMAQGAVASFVPNGNNIATDCVFTFPEGVSDYVAWAEGDTQVFLAKKTRSVSIKFSPATANEGVIAKTDSNVGGYPIAGYFWNHSKMYTNTGTGTTEIMKVKDGTGAELADTRVFYYMPNMYDVNKRNVNGRNKQTTGNGKLTYSYFDDSVRLSAPTFPYAVTQSGFEDCSLPQTPAGKLHWEVGIKNIPYQVFDLYIYQASDQDGTISLLPIAVKANEGEWKYFAGDGNGKTIAATATDRWNGAPYCDSETMVEGTNYIRYRLSKAALGLGENDRIESIYLSHPNVSNGRLGLAGIQIVEVENDGYFTRQADTDGMSEEDKNWTAAGSWKNSSGTAINWPTEPGTAYVNINADEVAEVTVDGVIEADEVKLTSSSAKDFKFLTKESLATVNTPNENPDYILKAPVDATGFNGQLYLQSRIDGTITLGQNAGITFVSNVEGEETTAYSYNFIGAANITKVGPGSFLVPESMYTVPFAISAGSLRYDYSGATAATMTRGLSGAGKVVKTGSGEIVMNAGGTFTGGTTINGGTITLGANNALGAQGANVTVNAGGTLDINGKENHGINLTLAGGTLKNSSTAGGGLGQVHLRKMIVTADSVLDLTGRTGILNNGWDATTLTLNDKKLTKTGTGEFLLCNTTVSSGTIRMVEGGIRSSGRNAQYANGASNLTAVDFEIAGTGITFAGFSPTIKSLTFEDNGSIVAAEDNDATITVTGTVSGTGTANKLTLGEGATVDGSISVTGALAFGNTLKVKAALGETVFTLGEGVEAPATMPAVTIVDAEGEHTGYTLKADGTALKVYAAAKVGDQVYTTIAAAIEAAGNTGVVTIIDQAATIPSTHAKVTTGDVVTLRAVGGKVYYKSGDWTDGCTVWADAAHTSTTSFNVADTMVFTATASVYPDRGMTTALKVEVAANTTVNIGHEGDETHTHYNIPSGSTIELGDGASVVFQYWGNDAVQGTAKLGDVTINGANGTFSYNSARTNPPTFGAVTGTAKLVLGDGQSVTATSFETMPISGVAHKHVVCNEGVYSLALDQVTITIPEIANTTVTVTGGTPDGNTVTVDYGTEITVTYTPVMNYVGGGSVTMTATTDGELSTTAITMPKLRDPTTVYASGNVVEGQFLLDDQLVDLIEGDVIGIKLGKTTGSQWQICLNACAGHDYIFEPTDNQDNRFSVVTDIPEDTTVTIAKDVLVYFFNRNVDATDRTLNDGVEITGDGTLEVENTATVNGDVTISVSTLNVTTGQFKLADGATLTVPAALAEGKVTSAVESKKVVSATNEDGTVTYSLETMTFSITLHEVKRATRYYKIGDADYVEYTEPVLVPYGETLYYKYVIDDGYVYSSNGVNKTVIESRVETITRDYEAPWPSPFGIYQRYYDITLEQVAHTTVTVDGETVTGSTFTAEYGSTPTIVYKADEGYLIREFQDLNKEFTFTLKPVTAYVAAKTVGENLSSVRESYTYSIPTFDNATIVATIDGEVVDVSSGSIDVGYGKILLVTYTANDGYVMTSAEQSKTFTIQSGVTTDGTINGIKIKKIVASVGDVYYTTLTDAITRYTEEEAFTIKLLADITEDVEIPKKLVNNSAAITLDLNGKTVTGSSYVINFKRECHFTIIDTSEEQNGKLTCSGRSTIILGYSASLTLESGTIENTGSTDSHAIDTDTDFKMTGGSIVSSVDGIKAWGGQVKMSGGIISAKRYGIWVTGSSNVATAEITGGTIEKGVVLVGVGYAKITGGEVVAKFEQRTTGLLLAGTDKKYIEQAQASIAVYQDDELVGYGGNPDGTTIYESNGFQLPFNKIKLLRDIETGEHDQYYRYIKIAKSLIFDFNEHSVKVHDCCAFVIDGSSRQQIDVTFRGNGSVYHNNYSYYEQWAVSGHGFFYDAISTVFLIGDYADVTIEDGIYVNDVALDPDYYAEEGCEIYSSIFYLMFNATQSTVYIKGGDYGSPHAIRTYRSEPLSSIGSFFKVSGGTFYGGFNPAEFYLGSQRSNVVTTGHISVPNATLDTFTVKKAATVRIPTAPLGTTVKVVVEGKTITPANDGTITVAEDANVVVTYSAAEGYYMPQSVVTTFVACNVEEIKVPEEGAAIIIPAEPKATVTTLTKEGLDSAYTFTMDANESAETSDYYSDWEADFVVTFDHDVAADSLKLSGQYDGNGPDWEDLVIGDVTAGTEIKLISMVAAQLGYEGLTVPYSMIRDSVKVFNCGVKNSSIDNVGTVMTVKLVLTSGTKTLVIGEPVVYTLVTPEVEVEPTKDGIVVEVPMGADSVEVVDAEGEAVAENKIPLTTGVYTITAKKGATVVKTETLGVVSAKAAETGTAPARVTTAVAVPFKGKTVATLLNTALLNKDDTLMAWVDGAYATWTLTDGAWVGQDVINGAKAKPATTALKCGQAVWVTTAGKIVTFGDTAATGDTVEVTTGHNLLGSIAYTEAVPQTAKTDDQIQLIDEENISRYNKTADGWVSKIQKRTQLPNGKWVTTEETSNEAPTVKPGRGYWLIRK